MRTKEYILTALMLAMGLILHGIMPPIVGLPAPFAVLFTTVVLPALVSNVVIGTFVCKAILVATKNKITAV